MLALKGNGLYADPAPCRAAVLAFAFAGCFLASCALPGSHRANVVQLMPAEQVPCADARQAKKSCGLLDTAPDVADGFLVVVGWERFDEILRAGSDNQVPRNPAERLTVFVDQQARCGRRRGIL